MEWLADNWIWVLVGIAFVAMHLFGHGGHGGSGTPPGRGRKVKFRGKRREDKPAGHRH